MSTVLFLTAVVSAICVVVWYFRTARFRRLINQMPGPPTLPVIGNAHQMRHTGSAFTEQVMRWGDLFRKDGIFKVWLGFVPIIILTRAEIVEFLLSSSKHIDKSSEYIFLHPWLGTGLLTSTGEKWKSRRKMLTPTFHFRILHDFVEVFNSQTKVFIDKLRGHAGKGPFKISQDITLCTLDIICETAMGQHLNAQSQESDYVNAVYKICNLIERRMRTPWLWNETLYNLFGLGPKLRQCLKILHDFTLKVIKERMDSFDAKAARAVFEEISQNDNEVAFVKRKRLAFLDLLIYMAQNNDALSINDIREEVDTFMFEGHDTTSAALGWATFLLAAHPEIQSRVQEELDGVFGDSERMPTMEDLKELKYLECCIKEALRIYPSVPIFGRTAIEEAHIGPYTIPKGVSMYVFTAALHRDSRWFPNPEEFNPDNFLPENTLNRHPFAYTPFSAGLRNCIGQKFALLEEKVILSSIFRNFKVTTHQTAEELMPVGELILRPTDGITVELSERQRI